MNDQTNEAAIPISVEDGVNAALGNARECIRERHRKCRDKIRETPTRAVLGGVAVGYLLHRLPLRSILVTQVRVLAALTPPSLLFFGAAKLYEFLQRQDFTKRK